MFKLMTAREAADLVRDGDLLALNGMVRWAVPEKFCDVLVERYRETGEPNGLGLLASTGYNAVVQFAQFPGMINRLFCGHWKILNAFSPAILAERIEANNIPQGIAALNFRAAAQRMPGFLSRAGLGTFIDPRLGNGAYNEISKKKPLAKVMEIDGEEFLFYRTMYPDVCVLRGTSCDPWGNITFEKEGGIVDALALAQAVHNHHGTVIVQVERLIDHAANPHDVVVPGMLVDVVYVQPEYPVLFCDDKDAKLFTGEERVSEEEFPGKVLETLALNLQKRSLSERIVARRAALELKPGDIVNLGTGIPMLMALEAYEMGIVDRNVKNITFTIESGAVGGIPYGPIAFGSNINVGAFISQNQMFDFYEGNGIDITGVGALEIDRKGDVNVTRKGDRIFGIGGFNHVATSPRRLLFCTRFAVGSDLKRKNGAWIPVDGKAAKFCEKVEWVCFNARRALGDGQQVRYITERGVFRLIEGGLELIEITSGLDVQKDILAHLPFEVAVSTDLKPMPAICFQV